jgi:hypothetical protein
MHSMDVVLAAPDYCSFSSQILQRLSDVSGTCVAGGEPDVEQL